MRVPAVVADQVLALVGNVLREFGQEVQRGEDLEIAAGAAAEVGAGRAGEAAAVVLLGTIDHRAVVAQADHAGQAEGTTQNVLGQTLQAEVSPGER